MSNTNHLSPTILTIAGSDSSGGAGIQADIKTISALGGYAASAITALTAQNTLGVQSVFEISPQFLSQQLQSVFEDLNVQSVKIGMLHSREIIEVVALSLEKYRPKHVVLDPVMISKSGAELLKLDTIDYLKSRLFPCVDVITPNVFEAQKISQKKINSFDDMLETAKFLSHQHGINVLLKGGHLENCDAKISKDVLCIKNSLDCVWFEADRIHTQNTHGTGCTLSSAIATYLSKNINLEESIGYAKKYLTQALQSGSQFQVGHGCGPVDHYWQLRE